MAEMEDESKIALSEECIRTDAFFMNEALKLAADAGSACEDPVGAVVVKDGMIIGRGKNRTEETKNPFAHAEMIAMTEALAAVGGWRLTGCDLYVTLEPCAMCAGAIVHGRIRRVVIGTMDPKTGACGSVMNVLAEEQLNHQPEVAAGVLQEECSGILKEFFRQLRRKKK